MEIIYIAEDGTRFESADECLDYENTTNKMYDFIAEKIVFLTKENDELKILEGNDIEHKYSIAEYIIVKEEMPEEISNAILKYYGFTLPTKKGYFFYDSAEEEWGSIEDIISFYEDLIEKLYNI